MVVSYINNEKYIGTSVEIELIKKFLKSKRKCEINNSLLNYLETLEYSVKNDFTNLVLSFTDYFFQEWNLKFTPIPFERYMVNTPINIGGFYGSPVGGYKSFEQYGFSTVLDVNKIPNRKLIIYELCRNYLHDCIHFNTFKSYKINKSQKTVYRYQYGINFRNQNGISYSSVACTKKSPYSINLNVLMDGVTHIIVNEFVSKTLINELKHSPLNELERSVKDEIMGLSLYVDFHIFLFLKFYTIQYYLELRYKRTSYIYIYHIFFIVKH